MGRRVWGPLGFLPQPVLLLLGTHAPGAWWRSPAQIFFIYPITSSVVQFGAECSPGPGRCDRYLGYHGALFPGASGQEDRPLPREEGEGRLIGCSGIAVSQRAMLCPGFAGYNTFKVFLLPRVNCLGLRDGTAWQLCPFFTLYVMTVEHVFREQGLPLSSGKVPLHRVVFHWGQGQH